MPDLDKAYLHVKLSLLFLNPPTPVPPPPPQATRLHGVLAVCLFGLASLSNCMEAVCRLPSPQFEGLLRYATSLLRGPQEPTQKHVVLFFGLALAFRPVLLAFDRSDEGLYCLLNLLRASPSPNGTIHHKTDGVTSHKRRPSESHGFDTAYKHSALSLQLYTEPHTSYMSPPFCLCV
jgi:hypothetical protein